MISNLLSNAQSFSNAGGKVRMVKINVDENPSLAEQYNVATIPRVLMFKGSDQPVFEHVGTISDADLSTVLQANL